MNLTEALQANKLKAVGAELSDIAKKDRSVKAIADMLNKGKQPSKQDVQKLKGEAQDEVIVAFASVFGPTKTMKEYGIEVDEDFMKDVNTVNTTIVERGKYLPVDIEKAVELAKSMSGNMTGAVNKIEKIRKGLSKHPTVANALHTANESVVSRFKTIIVNMINEDKDIKAEYKALSKKSIGELRGLLKQQSKVSDTSEFKTKDHAISAYLRAKHGDKKVAKAFGLSENTIEVNESKARGNKKIKGRNRLVGAKNATQYLTKVHSMLIDGLVDALKEIGVSSNAANGGAVGSKLMDLLRKHRPKFPKFKGEDGITSQTIKNALFSKSSIQWSTVGKNVKFTYTVPVEAESQKTNPEYGDVDDMRGLIYHVILGQVNTQTDDMLITGFETTWKNLSESNEITEATVSDARYVNAHGKKPKNQTGGWIFTTKRMGSPKSDETFETKGSLADAKKAAKAWAKQKGVDTIYIMESSSKIKSDQIRSSKLTSAINRMEKSRARAVAKAKKWMKKTGKSAEDAMKEFDLLKGDLKYLEENFKKGDSVLVKDNVKTFGKKKGKVTGQSVGEIMVKLDGEKHLLSFRPSELIKEDQFDEETKEMMSAFFKAQDEAGGDPVKFEKLAREYTKLTKLGFRRAMQGPVGNTLLLGGKKAKTYYN